MQQARMAHARVEQAPKDEHAITLERVDRIVTVIADALTNPSTSAVLKRAGVVIRIDLDDLPEGTVCLLFDRDQAAITRGVPNDRPDIILRMRSTDLEGMLQEGKYLPMRILSGAVTFDGCVRKFLSILPVLRAATDEAVTALASLPAPRPALRAVS